MSAPVDPSDDRKSGKIVRLMANYGFIVSDDVPDKKIHFTPERFRGSRPLRKGDVVTFQLKGSGTNLQAYDLTVAGEGGDDTVTGPGAPSTRLPIGPQIFDWAFLGYLPKVLTNLAKLALDERWEFKNEAPNPERPFPILRSYLLHTFGRLVLEKKVLVNEKASLAAFNTGLVDPRYEPIHALFSPNDGPRPWKLSGFCIAGEDADGQNLVRNFAPLPSPAHYFDNSLDLLYDVQAGKPELDWDHIIIQRINRYPTNFVQDHWPPGFDAKDTTQLTEDERKDYFLSLGAAIKKDARTYCGIMNRVKDAIDLSIKRTRWNFKTAIPTYYPRVQQLQLLLPMCLLSDDQVDLALAVEKTQVGTYRGHTALPLDWAYKNARLVCRPDSDWLAPKQIAESLIEEDE